MIPEESLDTLHRERERITRENAETHVRLTRAEARRHAWQLSRFFAVFSLMLIAAALTIGVFEVDEMRRDRAAIASAEVNQIVGFRKDYLESTTSLGKKMDTQAEAIDTQAKGFRTALIDIRKQLRDNTNVTAKAATANTQIAQEAVKATAATTQIADKISAADPQIVKVEVPKAAPPVVVQAPAPAAAHVPAQQNTAAASRSNWLKRLFRWGKRGGANQ